MSGNTSNVVKHLLRRWQTRQTIPYLKQGSSISILSTLPNTNLRIRSQWRDDGELSFHQYTKPNEVNAVLAMVRNVDKRTSLGRVEAHVSIRLEEGRASDGRVSDRTDDELALSGSDYNCTSDNLDGVEFPTLTLDIPDKINLECNLMKGGSIAIENKIEGDVHLKIRNGTITITKVRGHSIDLEIGGSGDDPHVGPSSIFVSDVLESQALRISLPCSVSSRFRAKRLHANKLDIQLGGSLLGDGEGREQLVSWNQPRSISGRDDGSNHLDDKTFRFMDDDDSGAACDVSSLYVIGDAHVSVFGQSKEQNDNDGDAGAPTKAISRQPQPQAVRIKSHHGHVHVETTTPKPDFVNKMTGEVLPIVDLGGINGSCEVWVAPSKQDPDDPSPPHGIGWTSCHAHFDSIARDSVSILQTESGRVHVTIDRKVESDVRMLSLPKQATSFDVEPLLLEDNEDGSMADELCRMLKDLEDKTAGLKVSGDKDENSRIKIRTKAFTPRERLHLKHDIEFIDGWVENTTSEPDSRFDRKVRGVTDQHPHGGGKIRLNGAHDQALQGFQQHGGESTGVGNSLHSSSSASSRPLLAVCSPDGIVLESLSWLGNIARRYGLDETRKTDDLGRQATRRDRFTKPMTQTRVD